jgi:glycosyltransferase involved in cell wall biosynthesis
MNTRRISDYSSGAEMKIAYVYDAVYPWVKGGAEKRVHELSRTLAERGHEVHCYGMKWWPGEADLLKDGVYLHGVCRPMPLHSGKRRSVKEAVYFAGRLLLSLKQDCDLVDCQEFPYFPCFSARLLCSLKRSELFITWHEIWGDYWYEYLGRRGIAGRWVEMAASRLTKRNIAVSEMTRKGLAELGVKGTSVVPNGIDFRRIEQAKASEKESDIIYTGRLVSHKNVDLLIRAIGLVRRDIGDISAVIVGDGPERDKLKALVHELNLEKNVEFTGFLDYDASLTLMKSSGIFVSPSTREGFGMAALEANACGLPVVTLRHRMNAVTDLVKNTGFVCEPSPESLADGIVKGLAAKSEMNERCKRAAEDYDWERICDLAEKVYSRSD